MDLIVRAWIGFFSVFFLFTNSFGQGSAIPIICDQEYALCTSARCIPIPGNSVNAISDCVVEKGKSAGYKTCKERRPFKNKYQVTSLISTFSFKQFATKQPMNCAKGLPWTDCVDMPCTVDPQNSKRALCSCAIDNTQAFFTFGGSCNTDTCAKGFWSGATPAKGIILRNALMKVMPSPPQKLPEACPAKSS